MNRKFYVYFHKDPTNNQVKYIGKGQGRRAYSLNKRSIAHLNWIKSLAERDLVPTIEIVQYFGNEDECLRKEAELIQYYKGLGKVLLNISEGGSPGSGLTGEKNGAYGRKRPDLVARNKANKGKKLIDIYGEERAIEITATLSKASSGKNNPMYGKTGKAATCFGRIGQLHPMYGKKQTKAAKRRISASLRLNRGTKIVCSNGIIYPSLSEASRELQISRKYILEVLKNVRVSHKGLTFQYVTLTT